MKAFCWIWTIRSILTNGEKTLNFNTPQSKHPKQNQDRKYPTRWERSLSVWRDQKTQLFLYKIEEVADTARKRQFESVRKIYSPQ